MVEQKKDFAEKSEEYCRLVDILAELEHRQWMTWSKDLASKENLSEKRLERWKKLWVAYEQLSEEDKKSDRLWSRLVLDRLHQLQYILVSKKQKAILSACTSCDWHFESCDPYEIFVESVKHALKHKVAWKKLEKKLEVGG